MNHQPFENWLLSEEPLSFEQSQALQEHLRTCDTCCQIETAWESVHDLMQAEPNPAPAPGFTLRWQHRLAEQRRKRHQQQSWIFLGITGGIALALLATLAISTLTLVKEPDQILIYWVYRLTTLLISASSVKETLASLVTSITSAVPFAIWIGISGLGTMLSVIWFVLIKQLSTQRRIVQ